MEFVDDYLTIADDVELFDRPVRTTFKQRSSAWVCLANSSSSPTVGRRQATGRVRDRWGAGAANTICGSAPSRRRRHTAVLTIRDNATMMSRAELRVMESAGRMAT